MEPNVKVINNKQFWLNARDFLRGSLVSVITAALTVIQNSVAADEFTFKWKTVTTVSITAFIAYLLKNFLEPANTTVEIKPAAKTAVEGALPANSQIQIDMTEGQKPVVTTSVG